MGENNKLNTNRYNVEVICPDCGGNGVIDTYATGCCNNYNEDGTCCRKPIPKPIKMRCCRCNSSGYLNDEYELE